MKAIRIHGPRDARLDEIEEPVVTGDDQVKIRIESAGVCGSDLWLYETAPVPDHYRHPAFGESGPHVLGHEMAGRVVLAGRAVTGLAAGDLVAVRPLVADGTCATCRRGETNLCEQRGFVGINGGGGGFSEYVVVPVEQVHRLPAPFTAATGSLVEPLATSWHTVDAVPLTPEDPVLVVGAGPIGIGVLLCLRARGTTRVLVSEPSALRRGLAARWGAEVIDPRETDLARHARAWSERRGVAAAFDCAGAGGEVIGSELRALRPGGHLVVPAEFHARVEIDPTELARHGKRILGSSAYRREDFDAVIRAVADGRLDPTGMITSTIALEDTVAAGLEHLLGAGRDTDIKVLVTAGTSS
ncbi:alcohol dehydrogenase catalytic domain-containing protein [Nocardioides sp. LHD-245]|uniref:alcohol dehydrogenase catalytic domain-containing protein n=1 Tax=Nocardioides sp. LHD-245 TaxID=3051387 RepID=UPI0027E1D88C|nr:alcohol dehydrogenase catalytic domain-containing protein [Nocardioides sp. LHD-245]